MQCSASGFQEGVPSQEVGSAWALFTAQPHQICPQPHGALLTHSIGKEVGPKRKRECLSLSKSVVVPEPEPQSDPKHPRKEGEGWGIWAEAKIRQKENCRRLATGCRDSVTPLPRGPFEHARMARQWDRDRSGTGTPAQVAPGWPYPRSTPGAALHRR